MFFLFLLGMGVLPEHVDRKSSHDTSVVASHVDHVIGLSVLNVSHVFSLGQSVVNLFFSLLERRRTSVSAKSS